MNRLGSAGVVERRQANYAFSLLLRSQPFVQDSNLVSLFSCRNFDKKIRRGEKRLESILMYGIVVGILGVLAEFQRKSKVVDAFPNSFALKQYVLRTPKHRAFE